jgi:uncharacterized protein YecE (DUF72 family)
MSATSSLSNPPNEVPKFRGAEVPTVRSSEPRNPGIPELRIGCSGWHYKSWRGVVYPERLAPTAWLREYATRFPTVEINNSFYRLPSAETFAGWRTQVPRGFVFSVKASRFLTHIKRLRDPAEPLARLLSHARALGPTLGPILYQQPPRWFPDADRLRLFLESLPERVAPSSRYRLRHVMEFREPAGYEPWVLDLLEEYNVALCVHDMPGSESPLLAIGPVVYLRLHGFGKKYGGSYPDDMLMEWGSWLVDALRTGRECFVYFNNDMNGYAVRDATRLRAIVDNLMPELQASGSSVATVAAWEINR